MFCGLDRLQALGESDAGAQLGGRASARLWGHYNHIMIGYPSCGAKDPQKVLYLRRLLHISRADMETLYRPRGNEHSHEV